MHSALIFATVTQAVLFAILLVWFLFHWIKRRQYFEMHKQYAHEHRKEMKEFLKQWRTKLKDVIEEEGI